MPLPDHISTALAALDPAARVVVEMVWHLHETQMGEFRRLSEQLAERDAQVAERDAQNAALKAQNETFKKMIFGRRSEKLPPIASEVRKAIDEADFPLDLPANATAEDIKEAEQSRDIALSKARRKKGRKDSEAARERQRKALLKLPVVHEQVLVTASQFPEGTSREDFRTLGEGDVIRRIEHVREHLVCVEYHMEKLVERNGDRILQAASPPNVVEGGAWGPSVYAHVVVSKCVDSLPLYRQERILGRAGHPIARSVLCGLFHRAANELEPLYDRLLELVKRDPYLNADETTLRVGEKHAARTAWFWTVLSKDIVTFRFSETRAAETANDLLSDTSGTLQVDGYSGYNDVTGEGGRERVGCWAHARRKFFDARASAPEVNEILALITQLYRVEHKAAELGLLGTDAHGILRDEESRPILEKIYAWIEPRTGRTPPKSPLGAAVTYAVKQRKPLSVFLGDAKLPLDNNIAERALRIVALGRKNFLVVGNAECGKNLAILQSLTSTCQLHNVNPYEYLRDVLVRVGSHPNSKLDELLPMHWKPPAA